VLAYVFWHSPAAGADLAAYEGALRDFHEVLRDDPPDGFFRSAALRVEGAPWLPGGAGYEDWYLVGGFADLGALNEAAVAGRRRAPHDVVAGRSDHGAGGVYAHWAGAPEVGAGTARWFAKGPGTSYGDLRSALPAAPPATTWQRQLVLGPAPEFRLLGGLPPSGAVVVATTRSAPVWPSPPATPAGP
jgi:hypothetical protein